MTSLTARQQAQRQAMTAELQRAIATHGIEPLLDRLFGAGNHYFDPIERLWITPDRQHRGPGRGFLCIRPDGSWFKACLPEEDVQ